MATEQQEHLKIEQLRQHSADEIETHRRARARESRGMDSGAGQRRRGSRGAGEGVRLSRRHHDHAQGRLAGCGLSLRPPLGLVAGGFLRARSSRPTRRAKVNIAYSDIAALAFTGRDTAAGKTFEAWVKKYWEKKAAGEKNIQIEPEKLD